MHLLTKDRGWLAVYFDALSRLSQTQQAHFTESPSLKQLYDIFRAGDTNTTAVKGVFPRAPDLMVLFSRVQWDANGEPHVPGNLAGLEGYPSPEEQFQSRSRLGSRARIAGTVPTRCSSAIDRPDLGL